MNRMALLVGVAVMVFIATLSRHPSLYLTNDSVNYLSAGRLISEGLTPLRVEGYAYNEWSPLLPVIISYVWSIGIVNTMSILSAVIASLIVIAFGVLATEFIEGYAWVVAVCLIALSPAHSFIQAYLWSENLFILLSLVTLYALLKAHSWQMVIISALLCSLVALERYIGLMMIATGVIWILSNTRSWRKAFVCGAIATIPIGLWIARNLILTGLPFGVRVPSFWSVSDNIVLTVGVLWAWFPPKTFLSLEYNTHFFISRQWRVMPRQLF